MAIPHNPAPLFANFAYTLPLQRLASHKMPDTRKKSILSPSLSRPPSLAPPPRIHPIRVDAKRRDAGVAAEDALNLADPETILSGDWHDFCWRDAAFPPRQALCADAPEFGVLPNVLKTDRTFDARPSLRMLGHPAGLRRTPVWCSHHDRAVVEVAFRNWTTGLWTRWPVAPWVIADWLGTEDQVRSLCALAERLEVQLPNALVEGWRSWRLSLDLFAEPSFAAA